MWKLIIKTALNKTSIDNFAGCRVLKLELGLTDCITWINNNKFLVQGGNE